jgi:hypothetical protein
MTLKSQKGRPKGSKDTAKRKRKVFLNGKQERELIKDYEKGLSVSDITKKYNISKVNFSTIKKQRGVKNRIHNSELLDVENVDVESKEEVSGIYGIYFEWIYDETDEDRGFKVNNIKIYIGSSVNMNERCRTHLRDLKYKNHYSKDIQKMYDSGEYNIKIIILEKCEPEEVMQKESEYQYKWNKSCLLNKWRATNLEDIEPFLKKAVTLKAYTENYTINDDGCKLAINVDKSGYGEMQVRVDEENKYIKRHRIAYWEKHGTYPELIRHKCDNRGCYNADHLEEGNHRDNALDKRGDFPERFEKKWLEFKGDVVKLTEEFEWKPNMNIIKGGGGSASVYEWEKKLGIRNKYPDIIERRIGNKSNYSAEMKDFIRERLDKNTSQEIQDQFLEEFEMEVPRHVIYRLGGTMPMMSNSQSKHKEMYDFIRANLRKYYDWELCVMVNLKFDMLLSVERFLTLRFKKEIYRGGLKPEKTLSRKEADIYGGPEYKYFLKENYKLFTDKELAVMILDEKILSSPYMHFKIQDSKYSMTEFVRRSRLIDFGFLKDGEEAIPSGKHWQTGEPIYAFLLDEEAGDP